MSGYTPVFNTVFEGSMFGRYPDTAAWMFFLALADWRGEVDKTPEYIAGVTGMPIADLKGCIERFTQPDPHSRSQAEEGRKLVLIDSSRTWGWRVVNIALYREKAGARDQITDGRNAAKVRRYKERHRRTPEDTGRPPETPTHTHTQTHTQTKSKTSLRSGGARTGKSHFVPEDFQITEAMREWAAVESPTVDVDAETKKFRDHEFKDPHCDWGRAWRRWMRSAPEFKPRGSAAGKTKFDLTKEAMRNA